MPQKSSTDTVADYREFGEQLSDYIRRIEKVEFELHERGVLRHGIISSRDFEVPRLTGGDVEKWPITWRLYEYTMFYVNKVKEGAVVEKHSHDEDVFRLIMDGSLIVNGKKFTAGDWFVVRAGEPYGIETKSGYTVLCGYAKACMPPEPDK